MFGVLHEIWVHGVCLAPRWFEMDCNMKNDLRCTSTIVKVFQKYQPGFKPFLASLHSFFSKLKNSEFLLFHQKFKLIKFQTNKHTWNRHSYFLPMVQDKTPKEEPVSEWERFIIFRQILQFQNNNNYLFLYQKMCQNLFHKTIRTIKNQHLENRATHVKQYITVWPDSN